MEEVPAFIQKIVTSTRVRLARNLAAYPFPAKIDETLSREVLRLAEKALKEIDDYKKYEIGQISKEEATWLQEQYLVSPALLKKKNAAAFVSADNSTSIMINEEDHVREQYIYKGFHKLIRIYGNLSGLDDELGERLNFAYDDKLGYLTSCPSNLGTGMRLSVMTFLPGLTENGEMQRLADTLKSEGFTVRGAFGEGTKAEGYTYQISFDRTLGRSEMEIIKEVERITMNVCDLEIRARDKMLEKNRIPLRDDCLRAFGALTNCAVLSHKEMTTSMVKVRLGVALGFFKLRDENDPDCFIAFNDFIANMRPASFCRENGLFHATEYERELMRAEIVGRVLPELVTRVD